MESRARPVQMGAVSVLAKDGSGVAKIRIKGEKGFTFEAVTLDDNRIGVGRRAMNATLCTSPANQEESARQWLGDMGLEARCARRLLDAALRGTGPFSNPGHPRRI